MLVAEANVARMLHPLEDPRMAGFREALAEVNAAADKAPGFVWRLQTETGDATGLRLFEDPLVILNASVWVSHGDLLRYTYGGLHARFFRRRSEWFARMAQLPVALWWVRPGEWPTPEGARARLEALWRLGPTAEAFTFQSAFGPEGTALPIEWRRGSLQYAEATEPTSETTRSSG